MPSVAVEDEETQLSVHQPSSRVALVFDLVERPQMPLAVTLLAPEGIIVARISRLDPPRVVRASLCRNPPVFHLDVFARRALGCHRSRLGNTANVGITRRTSMAVRDMVGRSRRGCTRSRRIDIGLRRVAIARCVVVVSPLVRVIEVSKRVQRAIQAIVVVTAVCRAISGVVRWAVVVGLAAVVRIRLGVGLRVGLSVGLVVGTGCIYPRIAARCDTNTNAHAYAHAYTNRAVAIAGVRDDASRVRAVCLLALIDKGAALAIAGLVDVGLARLWVGLHCGSRRADGRLDCSGGGMMRPRRVEECIGGATRERKGEGD